VEGLQTPSNDGVSHFLSDAVLHRQKTSALFPPSGMFIHRPTLAIRWITAVARDKAAQWEADDSLGVTTHPAHVSILA
jgi:hypothetical protein